MIVSLFINDPFTRKLLPVGIATNSKFVVVVSISSLYCILYCIFKVYNNETIMRKMVVICLQFPSFFIDNK